jgi:ankyrin repeat protein
MKHNEEFNTDLVLDEVDRGAIIDETSEHYQILKEKQLKHRQFVLEQERVKNEEDKKKLKEKKDLMQQVNVELQNRAYVKRRNQSAKYREIVHNEKIKNLIHKVDHFLKKYANEPLTTEEELKQKALEEYLQEEAKKKAPKEKINGIVSRLFKLNPKDEEERKKNKEKIERSKSKTFVKRQNTIKPSIVKKASKNSDLSNANGLFVEEVNDLGTNSMPMTLPVINKRVQSAKISRVVENRDDPDTELKKIVKNGCNVEELMAFQKKYKWYDISNYLHKVKLKTIKNKSTIEKPIKRVFIEQELTKQAEEKLKANMYIDDTSDIEDQGVVENNTNINRFQEEELVADQMSPEQGGDDIDAEECNGNEENNDEYNNNFQDIEEKKSSMDNADRSINKTQTKSNKLRFKDDASCSYVNACKYNNEEFIKAHLMSAKDDEDMVRKVNERDVYGRKGIMYLILHGNYDMIKLTLMSGIILGDCIDNYGRNIIHYCSLSPYNDIIDIICRCIIFEHKEQHNDMITYLNKVYLGTKYNIESIPLEKEQVDDLLSTLDDSITNKTKIYTSSEPEQVLDELMYNSGFDGSKGVSILKPTTLSYNLFVKTVKKVKTPLSHVINMKDSDNRTPLHIAAMNNYFESIKVLTYYNAKLDDYDNDNKVQYLLILSDLLT